MLDMGFEPEVRYILGQTCSGKWYVKKIVFLQVNGLIRNENVNKNTIPITRKKTCHWLSHFYIFITELLGGKILMSFYFVYFFHLLIIPLNKDWCHFVFKKRKYWMSRKLLYIILVFSHEAITKFQFSTNKVINKKSFS